MPEENKEDKEETEPETLLLAWSAEMKNMIQKMTPNPPQMMIESVRIRISIQTKGVPREFETRNINKHLRYEDQLAT